MEIYTIGHSVHSKERFAEMLHFREIQLLADVRAFPGSKKFPQFSKDNFPTWLKANGWNVKHIIDGSKNQIEIVDHELGKWGAQPLVREDGSIVYPQEV